MDNLNNEKKSNDSQPNENCKAVQFVTIDIVECLVENSKCAFPKSYGKGWYCTHPTRKEIAKRTQDANMKK
jgi:hypothetical protein